MHSRACAQGQIVPRAPGLLKPSRFLPVNRLVENKFLIARRVTNGAGSLSPSGPSGTRAGRSRPLGMPPLAPRTSFTCALFYFPRPANPLRGLARQFHGGVLPSNAVILSGTLSGNSQLGKHPGPDYNPAPCLDVRHGRVSRRSS